MACSSQWGAMVDFLRANPYVSREEYLWEWTLPQAHIAAADFTYTDYRGAGKGGAKARERVYEDPADFAREMGMPVAR